MALNFSSLEQVHSVDIEQIDNEEYQSLQRRTDARDSGDGRVASGGAVHGYGCAMALNIPTLLADESVYKLSS